MIPSTRDGAGTLRSNLYGSGKDGGGGGAGGEDLFLSNPLGYARIGAALTGVRPPSLQPSQLLQLASPGPASGVGALQLLARPHPHRCNAPGGKGYTPAFGLRGQDGGCDNYSASKLVSFALPLYFYGFLCRRSRYANACARFF